MSKSIACVFPDTIPDERFLSPLVQVFGHVVHMQAIEDSSSGPQTKLPATEQYRQKGQLQSFIPVPLGDDRERFHALIQDIQRRGDTYLSQLGLLTLAGLSRREQLSESHHSILSDLLHHAAITEQTKTDLLLWQSRLIVKLGELYDLEQKELEKALLDIAHKQGRLFAELCEEEETPFVLPPIIPAADPEKEGIIRHRLKAWTRLCFHEDRQAPGLLVTSHQVALDLLQEFYEKNQPHGARKLGRLKIPALYTASGQGEDCVDPLISRCPSLEGVFASIAAAGSVLQCSPEMEQLLQMGLVEWEHCTTALMASTRASQYFLDLFFFPETTTPQLLSETFCGNSHPVKTMSPSPDTGCVVALLNTD